MTRHPSSRTAAGTLLFAVLASVLVAGCADPSDDPRASASGTPSGGMRYCPSPQEPPIDPSVPCISQDPAQKYAENHAYRQEMEIGEEERAGAQGKADALAEALKGLVGKPVGEVEVRAAAAAALGLEPADVEYRAGTPGKVLKDVVVGGGRGKVCVNGNIDSQGNATAEVAGRTMDGTCLPGLGGH
ncbi:precorrin-3B C(17)-methyltransferase [Streptomyces cinereoruber]|uniref:precorrin-3B C(17)-methyltransferase n=1 Tax=Streptomyces cinereoruber TaxID=67260 RepID=UPI0036321EDA